MNTPYWRKTLDLAAALAASPRDLPCWLLNLPVWRRRPIDVELPWWSCGAIRFLAGYLQPHHRVFEYGSGGSSLFVARRVAALVAVENDPAWHQLLLETAARRNIRNLDCELHPFNEHDFADFRRSGFSRRVLAEAWDAVIIDCNFGLDDPPFGLIRPAAFTDTLTRVKPGGVIVLDDSWMYPELLAPRPGWAIHDFRGLGPCRFGVTSTAVFQRLA
ncbi:MAG: hypothetical protein ACHQ5A_05815 [Opitutales bacterium]